MKYPTAAIPGFTFGCDPEVFIKDPSGRFVSAAGLLPGTKAEPFKVPYGAVQVDGMLGEFNIDPVENFEDFNRNVTEVLRAMKGLLPKGYSIDLSGSALFDEDVFEEAPPEAKAMGCDPDYNAWTSGINPPPNPFGEDYRRRCAGGHIHMGWVPGADASISDEIHLVNCMDMVKQLDWFVGAWCVTKEEDRHRRRLYGQAGSFRPKPYGVEYRVPGNFWIATKPLRSQLWDRVQEAITEMSNRFVPDAVTRSVNANLQNYINGMRRDLYFERCYSYPITSIAPSVAAYAHF